MGSGGYGGRLNLNVANPIGAAIDTYSQLQNIHRADRADARLERQDQVAAEDRQRQITRETKQDERQAKLDSRQDAIFEHEQGQRSRLVEQQGNEDFVKKVDGMNALLEGMPVAKHGEALRNWFDSLDESDKKRFIKGAAARPEIAQAKAKLQYVRQQSENFLSGKPVDKQGTVAALNELYGQAINSGPPVIQRMVDGKAVNVAVEKKEIVGLTPTPNGSFVPQLRVTGKDENGNPVVYEAPMTEGRDGSPEAFVKEWAPDNVFPVFDKTMSVLDFIDSLAVAHGGKEAGARQQKRKDQKVGAAILDAVSAATKGKGTQAEILQRALDAGMKVEGADPARVAAIVAPILGANQQDIQNQIEKTKADASAAANYAAARESDADAAAGGKAARTGKAEAFSSATTRINKHLSDIAAQDQIIGDYTKSKTQKEAAQREKARLEQQVANEKMYLYSKYPEDALTTFPDIKDLAGGQMQAPAGTAAPQSTTGGAPAASPQGQPKRKPLDSIL